MRLLEGSRILEAPPEWRAAVTLHGRRVVIDVGAGDGRFVYESARRDADALYIAVDPDAAALGEYAFRAARKPARGGVDNAIFVVAALEALPPELLGLADIVRVNFPWSGLLRGLLRPEPAALEALLSLLRPDGLLELVLCYDASHDSAALDGDNLPSLDARYIDDVLTPAYARSGIVIEARHHLDQVEALALPSTWGRRLLHGRPRDVFFLICRPGPPGTAL